jgi:2-iminobutanoate/2-iminopropanoate deaminase
MIRLTFFVFSLAALALPACAQTAAPNPAPEGPPFSPVIVSGDTIYLAGHLGRLPYTNDYPDGGIGPQTTQTLENIGATLATIGATHADLVRCQVFLADIADFAEMNAAYRVFFPTNPPARTTVAVAGLAANASIEIECTGVRGHSGKAGE